MDLFFKVKTLFPISKEMILFQNENKTMNI